MPGLTLATAATTVPAGEDWIHEIEYDGYRLLCRVSRGRAQLLTRAGKADRQHLQAGYVPQKHPPPVRQVAGTATAAHLVHQ